jgi:hypothetical protein
MIGLFALLLAACSTTVEVHVTNVTATPNPNNAPAADEAATPVDNEDPARRASALVIQPIKQIDLVQVPEAVSRYTGPVRGHRLRS